MIKQRLQEKLHPARRDLKLVSDARLNRIIIERERQRLLAAKKTKQKRGQQPAQPSNPLEDVEQVRIASVLRTLAAGNQPGG